MASSPKDPEIEHGAVVAATRRFRPPYFNPYQITLVEAEGWARDAEGRGYLDMLACFGVLRLSPTLIINDDLTINEEEIDWGVARIGEALARLSSEPRGDTHG